MLTGRQHRRMSNRAEVRKGTEKESLLESLPDGEVWAPKSAREFGCREQPLPILHRRQKNTPQNPPSHGKKDSRYWSHADLLPTCFCFVAYNLWFVAYRVLIHDLRMSKCRSGSLPTLSGSLPTWSCQRLLSACVFTLSFVVVVVVIVLGLWVLDILGSRAIRGRGKQQTKSPSNAGKKGDKCRGSCSADSERTAALVGVEIGVGGSSGNAGRDSKSLPSIKLRQFESSAYFSPSLLSSEFELRVSDDVLVGALI
eukprot:6490920-Amphidinium_carterae.3